MPSVLSYSNAFPTNNTLARNFNGTSDQVVASVASTVITNFSCSLWVKPGSPANSTQPMANGFGNGWGFNQTASTTLSGHIPGVGDFGAMTVPSGIWSHIAYVNNGGTNTTYLNGVAQGTTSAGPVSTPSTSTAIGSFGGGGYWAGQIADVAIWNTALNTTQLAALAAGTRPGSLGASNLVSWWPITGASPEPDKSGNGNNGTLNGTGIIGGPNLLQPLSGGIALPQHLTGQTAVQNYLYPGALQPQQTGPVVLSWTNAFPGIPTPQHLSGQTSVQSFFYPGALQPLQSTVFGGQGYPTTWLIKVTGGVGFA